MPQEQTRIPWKLSAILLPLITIVKTVNLLDGHVSHLVHVTRGYRYKLPTVEYGPESKTTNYTTRQLEKNYLAPTRSHEMLI